MIANFTIYRLMNSMDRSTRYSEAFAGVERLYGHQAQEKIHSAHILLVGVGGVGSWCAEALVRSGIGALSLLDHDDIALSNMNRQLHTLESTLGESKVGVLKERLLQINPQCRINAVDDLLTQANLESHIHGEVDLVIDAIDAVSVKAALIHHCKREKMAIITTGGAGGLIDPTRIEVIDLSRTSQDPLAAKVRSRLRHQYGFSRNPKRRFGVECVYSLEQPRYPDGEGGVSHEKPGVKGLTLDCSLGYGAATMVTASFGFTAAARAIARLIG